MEKSNEEKKIMWWRDYDWNDFYAAQDEIIKKRRGKRPAVPYWPEIITFDTETSKLDFNPKKSENDKSIRAWKSWVYVWTMQVSDRITLYGRDLDEFVEMLQIMSECSYQAAFKKIRSAAYTVCYIHNAAFEWSFLFSRLPIKTEDCFFREVRKPLYFRAYDVEFRCSYTLTNMSLSFFLEQMRVEDQKLSGQKYDYGKMRYPWTPMSDYEMQYAAHDVSGLRAALVTKFCHDGDTVASVPLTSTGYVRRECVQALKPLRNSIVFQNPDLEQVQFEHAAFRGGNTHANRMLVGGILVSPVGIDIASSYPTQQLLNPFPMRAFQWILPYENDIIRFIQNGYAVIMEVEFSNLHLIDEHEPFPYISISKCIISWDERSVKDSSIGKTDNGRLLGCRYARMTITEIDLQIITSQYDWSGMKFIRAMVARKDYLPESYRDVIKSFFQTKSELKKADREQDFTLAYRYDREKNKLNGIYGMSAQYPLKDMVKFDPDTYKYYTQKPEKLAHELMNAPFPYQWGVYTTCYARLELQQMIDVLKKYKVPMDSAHYRLNVNGAGAPAGDQCAVIYCDTDSVKYFPCPGMEEEIEAFNDQIRKRCDAMNAYATVDGKRVYPGIFEHDASYHEFITQGAKRYAYTKPDGKMAVTVSGVSKAINEETGVPFAVEELGSLENFKKDMTFNVSGGTISFYDDDTDMIYNPDHQSGHDIHIKSSVSIIESTYKMTFEKDYWSILQDSNLYSKWVNEELNRPHE